MRKCQNCGFEVADDAVFCKSCGSKIIVSESPQETQFQGGQTAAFGQTDPAGHTGQTGYTENIGNTGSTGNTGYGAPRMEDVTNSAEQVSSGPSTSTEIKPKDNKALIGVIIGGVAALVVLILLIVVIILAVALGGGGYKKPVKNLVNNLNNRSSNVEKYMDCVAPGFVSSTYNDARKLLKGGDAKEELDEAIEDKFDDAFSDLDKTYGKDWKISVEYKDVEKLDKDNLEDIQDSWEALYDILDDMDLDDEDKWEEVADHLDDEYDTELDSDKAAALMGKFVDNVENVKITAGYKVKIKFTIEGKKDEDSETCKVNIIKCNGKWIIDPVSAAATAGLSPYSLQYYNGSMW
ncbi:MAG: zinc ribbon domain-containing protein [Lachnospiraceae bacterium]|nr:zinc ribbon domain-containing protein [Lachnospiraceae bacterium]